MYCCHKTTFILELVSINKRHGNSLIPLWTVAHLLIEDVRAWMGLDVKLAVLDSLLSVYGLPHREAVTRVSERLWRQTRT